MEHLGINSITSNIDTGYSWVVFCPSMRKRRVWKAEVNKLAFTNIWKFSKEKLEKKNLWFTLHRRLVQERKYQNRKKRIISEFWACMEGSG